MEYLDNLITRLAAKCAAVSPSGGGGTGYLTVDSTDITVDSTLISSDDDTI